MKLLVCLIVTEILKVRVLSERISVRKSRDRTTIMPGHRTVMPGHGVVVPVSRAVTRKRVVVTGESAAIVKWRAVKRAVVVLLVRAVQGPDGVAVGDLVLVPRNAHRTIPVRKKIRGRVFVQRSKVPRRRHVEVGLHGALVPHGGGRGQGLVELVGCDGCDGGVGLCAPRRRHQGSDHVGRVRRARLGRLAHHAHYDKDENEEDHNAEAENQG